jgi:hypothetical protein
MRLYYLSAHKYLVATMPNSHCSCRSHSTKGSLEPATLLPCHSHSSRIRGTVPRSTTRIRRPGNGVGVDGRDDASRSPKRVSQAVCTPTRFSNLVRQSATGIGSWEGWRFYLDSIAFVVRLRSRKIANSGRRRLHVYKMYQAEPRRS